MLAHSFDSRGNAVDGIANVVENGIHYLQPPLCKCLRQRLLGEHALGNVAEDHHATPDSTEIVEQRPSTHPDVHAVRLVVVAYEYIHVIHRLTLAEDVEEWQIPHSHGRFPIGIEETVSLDPLLRRSVRYYVHTDDLFGRGIYVEGLPRYIGDDDAVADTVEHGFHQLALLAQFFYRFVQFRSCLFLSGDVAENNHAAAMPSYIRA